MNIFTTKCPWVKIGRADMWAVRYHAENTTGCQSWLPKPSSARILPFCWWAIIGLVVLSLTANGQQIPQTQWIKAKPPIVCSFGGDAHNSYVPPPEAYLRRQGNSSARIAATRAKFIVEYIDFPDEVKVAFDRAFAIWETQLVSDVPIRVRARWRSDLASGVLGSASPGSYIANFREAPKLSTIYPIALAEKIARRPLNLDSDPDIVCNFSALANWYLGATGDIAPGQYDLTSVVLHELGHGLGIVGSFGVSGNDGRYGGFSGYPFIYDTYVETLLNQRLVDKNIFPNPSPDLRVQLTGQNLYFNSPIAAISNKGARPRIFAPATYSGGSSISHLDEASYPFGDNNSLMTPNIAARERILDPGPLVMGMFAEMGWVGTSVLHEALKDNEETSQPVVFSARVKSDTTIVGNVQLFYTINDSISRATPVNMTRVGNTDEYRATLPASAASRRIRYYISVKDASTRTFTSPGEAPRFFYTFSLGPDTTPPEIKHSALGAILSSEEKLDISAEISDAFGIDTAYVEYQLNGVARPAVRLVRENATSSVFKATITFGAGLLKGGDRLQYRIVARDKAKAKNTGFAPATGFFTVNVNAISAASRTYVNDFDGPDPAKDFSGNAFSVTTPSGFQNPAIHSEHPYKNGTGPGDRSDYIYQLLVPIRLSSNRDSSVIRFDEIVLVEPGEPGAAFGTDDFYDYVVVEGSKDNGRTWIPFADGYDSRANSAWLSAYNRNISNQNSTTEGTPSLFRPRKIDLLASGQFRGGDQVLVRFRLLADQAAYGWGWCIDNLKIQIPDVPPITSLPASPTALEVYPNPSQSGQFVVSYRSKSAKSTLSVFDILGHELHTQGLGADGEQLLNLQSLPAGLYVLSITDGQELIKKRLVIAK